MLIASFPPRRMSSSSAAALLVHRQHFFSQSGDSPLRWSKRAMSAASSRAATGVGAANTDERELPQSGSRSMGGRPGDGWLRPAAGKNGVIQPASSTSIRRCLAPEKRITQFRQTAADGSAGSIQSMMVRPSLPSPPTIANGARRFRATIHQECAARGLDLANGAVAGVITEKGPHPDTSVCAGGAWTSLFCRQHGVQFPQASVRQTALRTRPTADLGEAI